MIFSVEVRRDLLLDELCVIGHDLERLAVMAEPACAFYATTLARDMRRRLARCVTVRAVSWPSVNAPARYAGDIDRGRQSPGTGPAPHGRGRADHERNRRDH